MTDVQVDLVRSHSDARAAVDVLGAVWPNPAGQPPLTSDFAWVLARWGNYVAIARRDGVPVGAAVGVRADGELGPHLHSHVTGAVPGAQGSGIGFVLKQHQRSWALAAGLDRIVWTADPLVARNAYFNVTKLGARLTEFLVNFYGPMTDAINAGDESDRCLVTWELASQRAVAAAAGRTDAPDLAALREAGAKDAFVLAEDGTPVLTGAEAEVLLVQLPRDIVALRQQNPALARAWRHALRGVFVPAFADGGEVAGVTRDSCFVLRVPPEIPRLTSLDR
ncbi:MAG: GNAT family N-acetyltransferase [Actinomycetota bacterium]